MKKRGQNSNCQPAESAPAFPSKKRTVLLLVSGMSPAILTETVWALAHPREGEEPIIPDEVVVITTTRGKADVERDLLNLVDGQVQPGPGWGGATVWQALRRALLGPRCAGDSRLQLRPPRVIELADPETGVKKPAPDLRSRQDNVEAANFILEEVRRFAEPDTRIIASIAGGRKTMGSLLYACMSLLGRETDRVTHVLVTSPFDECRGFFYPAQPVQDLVAGKPSQPIRAKAARIDLADIPFVPLINRFRDIGEVPGGFMGLVRTYNDWLKQDAAAAPQALIRIDRPHCSVCVNHLTCRIEGQNALEVLRFVFEANQRGWVNDANCRDFIAAAELFKASRGADFDPSRLSNDGKARARQIRAEFRGPPPDPWVKDVDSHKVSVPLSALRSFFRARSGQWVPKKWEWRLPSFRLLAS